MSRRWKAGIVGAGGISEAHLKAIKQETRIEVTAISDVSAAAVKARATEYGIPHVYTEYEQMINRADLDFIIVCVPNYLHSPVVLKALEASKHVLCEKPLALNSQEARQMADAARQRGKILMPAQNNRFRSDSRLLKKLIEQGKLGRVYHAKTGWVRRNGIPDWGNWFTDKGRAGGGPLIDVGVHMLDLTLWLMGYPKPASVFGQTYAEFGPRKKGLWGTGAVNENWDFTVEDMASAVITFENGASLVLDASWASHIEKESVYVKMYGNEGGAVLDFEQAHLAFYHELEGIPTDSILKTEPINERVLLLRNFIDGVEGNADPICKAEQGVYINEILDAIYQSAETGELIKLNKMGGNVS